MIPARYHFRIRNFINICQRAQDIRKTHLVPLVLNEFCGYEFEYYGSLDL
jgi:hypothetical protein